jgi:hypothetical protein
MASSLYFKRVSASSESESILQRRFNLIVSSFIWYWFNENTRLSVGCPLTAFSDAIAIVMTKQKEDRV